MLMALVMLEGVLSAALLQTTPTNAELWISFPTNKKKSPRNEKISVFMAHKKINSEC